MIPGLNIYLGGFLAIAACVMGMLAVMTCIQVFRLRNKRMSWRAGTLNGFPLFATLFLVISCAFAVVMWYKGNFWDFSASLLYLFISGSWFIASYFSSKRYITDNGIVKNVNDPAQTIAWHQIRDFVERENAGGVEYIFMYTPSEDETATFNLQRLELQLPEKKYESFKKLLSHKLGRRISCYESSMINAEYFKP